MFQHKSKAEEIQGQLGCLLKSFEETKTASDTNGKVHMLVCGTGQEMTYKLMLDFLKAPNIAKQVMQGKLKVFSLMSGKTLDTGETILGATINGYAPLDDQDNDLDGVNARKEVWKQIYEAADNHQNFVIFHVQMLGVGMDLPCLNSVVILGDKNETDLFQTIMRGCRVDYSNLNKQAYHVFIYVPEAVQTYMKSFIDVLDKQGGPDLIKAFSNDVKQGSSTNDYEAIFASMLTGTAVSTAVDEAYSQIINCKEYNEKSVLIKAIRDKMLMYRKEGKLQEYDQMRQQWFALQEELSGIK